MKKFHTDTVPNYIKYLTGYDAEQLYPDRLFPDLTAGRFQFVFKFHKACTRAAYIGASWRGLLGHALLETQCPFLIQKCDQCTLKRSCAYYCLYELKSEENGFSSVPRPYIIFPSGDKEVMSVDMTVTGSAAEFLPDIISAWIKAGEMGIGSKREKFKLHGINRIPPDGGIVPLNGTLSADYMYPLTDYLAKDVSQEDLGQLWKVHIVSPLRLMHRGRLLKEPDWFAAFKSLAVRVSALSRNYCGTPRLDNSVWNMLISFFYESCKTYNCISWKRLKRYSSRQKKYVPLDGIIGECMVAPENNRLLWWQWWQTAALFHLGKGTTMGLGKVKVSLT